MNNSVEMIPQYTTVLFTDVWDSAEDFKADLEDSAFAGCMQDGSATGQPDNVSLLYSRVNNGRTLVRVYGSAYESDNTKLISNIQDYKID